MQPDIHYIHNIHYRFYTLSRLQGGAREFTYFEDRHVPRTLPVTYTQWCAPPEGRIFLRSPVNKHQNPQSLSLLCSPSLSSQWRIQWISVTILYNWTRVETWLCFPNLLNFKVTSSLSISSPPFSPLSSAIIALKFIHAWAYGWISVV